MVPELKPEENMIPLHRARHEAAIFCDSFSELTERWEFAGSLRRECDQVGDIEHIIIPRAGVTQNSGQMFGVECPNLLFHRLDELVSEGVITKATYGDNARTRWGDKSRAFLCGDGIRHEVYSATVDTWGVVMALRTGPRQLSKRLVTQIKTNQYEVRDGNQVFPMGRDTPIPMQTEEVFFAICGIRYCEPKDRFP